MDIVTPRKGKRTGTNISVGSSSAVQIAQNNNSRKSLIIQNQGSQTVYIGDSTVTNSGATRGYALFSGNTFTDNASDEEWWAVGASSTNNLYVLEVT